MARTKTNSRGAVPETIGTANHESTEADASGHPSSAEAKAPSREPLSAESLALLAAKVAMGREMTAKEAVSYALALYDEAHHRLNREPELKAAYASEAAAWAQLPRPKKFPASLDSFLRLVVGGKTPADKTKRFRDFLRFRAAQMNYGERLDEDGAEPLSKLSEVAVENKALQNLAGYTAHGFQTEYEWYHCVLDFQRWWSERLTALATDAASRPRKKVEK